MSAQPDEFSLPSQSDPPSFPDSLGAQIAARLRKEAERRETIIDVPLSGSTVRNIERRNRTIE